MMQKVILFTVILGLAVAEPLRLASKNDVTYSEQPNYELAKTDIYSAFEIISALIGYKTSAISIAVTVIDWIVSNFYVIIIGATTVIGFCTLTDKCSLNYVDYIPVTQLQSYATPENIETAQRIFVRAVEKYAANSKREV